MLSHMSSTANSSAAIEQPTRGELVAVFAKRFTTLSLAEVGEWFDEYLRLGHLDIRRDAITGAWQVLLSERATRQ